MGGAEKAGAPWGLGVVLSVWTGQTHSLSPGKFGRQRPGVGAAAGAACEGAHLACGPAPLLSGLRSHVVLPVTPPVWRPPSSCAASSQTAQSLVSSFVKWDVTPGSSGGRGGWRNRVLEQRVFRLWPVSAIPVLCLGWVAEPSAGSCQEPLGQPGWWESESQAWLASWAPSPGPQAGWQSQRAGRGLPARASISASLEGHSRV